MAPNILFLMADQMQAQVLDPGHVCRTPNLDRLAAEGVGFPRAYTPNNICCPTRASLMTGLMPHNHGVLEVLHSEPDLHVLRPDKSHFAQRLVDVGYQTGYFGKWHVERSNDLQRFGWQVDAGWQSQAFYDRRRQTLGDADTRPPCDPAIWLDEPPGYGSHLLGGVTDRPGDQRDMGIQTTMALEYLQQVAQDDQPWCCFLSFQEPHDPFITDREQFEYYDSLDLPPPPTADDELADRPALYRRAQSIWAQLDESQKRMARACYYGSITQIDAQFGRVLDFIEQSGQAQETLVVMCADHGDLLGAHGLFFKDISAFEEIYRVPLIVRGPGVARGAECPARAGVHDLCPTLLVMADAEPIDVPDSRSFASLLRAPDSMDPSWERGYAEYNGNRWRVTQRVVWDGPWKLVLNGFDFDELYHLEQDPHETVNLAHDPAHRDRHVAMTRLAWDYIRRTGDETMAKTLYPALRLGIVGPQETLESD
ncbi:MAG: sulfatase-like hydrolase/transferase [Candidatus Latescibacteria bacterium]|nr:sulfatase-like hydrolase/transferase [Candidatus Latescibacterota bacterium]